MAWRRAWRFLIAGGCGFLLYLLLATALRATTALAPGTAALLATLLAVLPTFHLQRVFTFRSTGSYRAELLRYGLLQLLNSGVIALTAKLGAQWLRLADLPTFVMAGLVGVIVSYLLQATLVFGRRR